jgi:hypothetical protein
MKVPKSIELTQEQLDALLLRVKDSALQPGDYEIIKAALDTLRFLEQAYEEKTVSIKRLLRMLFGARTEKTKTVVVADDGDKKASGNNLCDGTNDAYDSQRGPCKEDPVKKRRKGHGRNGADAYRGADKIVVAHLQLKSGDPCPLCLKGRVYRMKMPGVVVRIVGRPPLDAKVYELEKLRCNLCGEVFTAPLPEQAESEKYDETARAMIGILKYGFGFPFHRLEKLQDCLGVPLPASTQWDKAEEGADLIYPVFEQLKKHAAQGSVIHNDDTIMKVLELMKNNDSQKDEDQTGSLRKGMFTTGILSVKDGKKIALFFTGHKHAGENFADLLKKRQSNRSPPIQMCDGLSRNFSEYDEVILAHCNVHARRKFVDVAENFPQECRYVLEVFEEIYKNDDISKKANMSPDQRLKFHQDHSGPIMEEFLRWLKEQFDDKKVEPNSGLGKAISYMLNHWKELTRFLHVPGAPLDNNILEQALKRVILNRKNSLFYKTLHGAYIGDMYMSLIHTCILAGKNPFDYITELQKHSSKVFKNPSQWMPWNYESTIAAMASDPCLNIEGAIEG